MFVDYPLIIWRLASQRKDPLKSYKKVFCSKLLVEAVLTFNHQLFILAPVVQKLDSATHRINHYPADKYYGNQLRYPLDRDLSDG